MNLYIVAVAVVIGVLAGVPALAEAQSAGGTPRARLAPNRMLIVDDKPTFIIGLYEHPKADARLKEAVDAGFDLIQCPPDVQALDRVHRLGARAWINTGYSIDLSEETAKRKAALAEMVGKFGAHPALLVWEGPDEALWNCWYGTMQQMDAEFAAMRKEVEARPELKGPMEAAMRCYDRSMWREWEALRTEFWRKAGKASPQPNVRMDTAAQRAGKMGDGMTAGARYLRGLDPGRFIWLNHAPRNSIRAMREHNRAVDMAGCDIYPIPFNLGVGHSDLVNTRPSSVGDYTDRMRQAAPGKACAMVLQGFGWRDLETKPDEARVKVGMGRRPNLREQRFMAWDAIVHGANAILYWGTAHLKEPDSDETREFWQDLLKVVREVRSLDRFIVAPAPRSEPRVKVEENFASNDGTGVRAMLRQAGGDHLLVVVNENPFGVEFAVSGLPSDLEGRTLEGDGSSGVSVRKGAVRDGIAAFDVHIYRLAGR